MDRRSFLAGLGATAATSIAMSSRGAPAFAQGAGVRLAVAGDVGTGNSATAAVADAVAGDGRFDALVLLGDNVYPDGDPDKLQATVFGPYRAVLDRARLFAVLGNHDVKGGNAKGQARALGMPARSYAQRVGNMLLVCLDSNQAGSPAQRAWLERTLSSSSEQWRVVALHHPPYSAGKHGSTEKIQRDWVPLFEAHGVHLVLAGHDHNYQRCRTLGGVTYVVTGGGGGDLYRTKRAAFTAELAVTHHYVTVDAGASRLTVEAVDTNGRRFDGVSLSG